MALKFRGENPPSMSPCRAPSAGRKDSLAPLLELKDLFHEAVATSVPLFKPTVLLMEQEIIFWIIYLKFYSRGVTCDRKESWSHQSLFNFTSVRGSFFCSDSVHFCLTWTPRITRIQTSALCGCHVCSG